MKGEAREKPENLNRRKLLFALLPFVLSLALLAGVYWYVMLREVPDTVLRIAAGEKGSESHAVITALAEVAQQSDEGIRIEPIATSGTNDNLTLLARGEADLATAPADAVFPKDTTLLASLYSETFQLLARRSLAIRDFGDLAGKRIALPPQASGGYRSFWLIASHYGIPAESLRITTVSGVPLLGELQAETVDAVFRIGASRNRAVRQIVDNADVVFVPIEQGAAIHQRFGALTAASLHKGSYRGTPASPEVELPTVAIDRLLVSRADAEEDVVRAITALLFEKRRDLGQREPLAAQVRPPDLGSGTLLPVHAGALAYFEREKPSLLAENSDLIGLVISLAAVLGSALLWLKRRFEEGRKGRIDIYNLDLARINAALAAAGTPDTVKTLSDELFDMLNRVISDLDQDKVAAEGFQTFAFAWEAVQRAAAERRVYLEKSSG